MDELESAIVSANLPDGSKEAWFQAVADSYNNCAESNDWDSFTTDLGVAAAQAGVTNDEVEAFIRSLEDANDRWGILQSIAEDVDATLRRYDELLEAMAPQESEGEEFEPWPADMAAQWYAAGQGSVGSWSGEESEWESFSEQFIAFCAENGAAPQARHFLRLIDEHPQGKVAAFAEIGITIGSADLGYDDATGLHYNADGVRFRQDSAGQFHELQWTDSNLYWVNVDGVDYWYDDQLAPYGAPETQADEAAADESETDESETDEQGSNQAEAIEDEAQDEKDESEANESEASEPALEFDQTPAAEQIAESLVEEVATAVSDTIDQTVEQLAAEFDMDPDEMRALFDEALESDEIEQAVQAAVQGESLPE